jgi:DNA-binding beta-propeller fold protein YncE
MPIPGRIVRVALPVLGLGAAALWFAPKSNSANGPPELVWGHRGQMPGDIVRPRAVAIDAEDRLYLVDFTARVQAYDLNGKHLGQTWTTPDFRNGRPSGLGIDNAGNLIVCDSHYHCVRIYQPNGELIRTLGGNSGTKPGEFGYVSDCVQDALGFYYISEFGTNDRITKLDADGKFVMCWGENGTEAGQFQRVRAIALGPDGNLYVADACNHRIQVFQRDGTFVKEIGKSGQGPGEFSYPYDIAFAPDGCFYVSERGNQRVQKFHPDGVSAGTWGSGGRAPGQVADPWALVVDRFGRVHVVDTENHRVQRVKF